MMLWQWCKKAGAANRAGKLRLRHEEQGRRAQAIHALHRPRKNTATTTTAEIASTVGQIGRFGIIMVRPVENLSPVHAKRR